MASLVDSVARCRALVAKCFFGGESMKQFHYLMALFVVAAMALGTVASPARAEITELNVLASEREFPRVRRSYESMDARYSRTGIQRTVAEIRQLTLGSSKEDLVRAVGEPVFEHRDGSWNFNIALPLTQDHRLICQYRVYFDDAARIAGTAWRRPQCVDIITARN